MGRGGVQASSWGSMWIRVENGYKVMLLSEKGLSEIIDSDTVSY